MVFSEAAATQCEARELDGSRGLRRFIEQVLQLDPRPAYRAGYDDARVFGMRLYDFDLRWRVEGERVMGLESPSVLHYKYTRSE